ncbi:MAG: hypothetical protein HQK58_09535 [Deltaproteobacteria bacterium]|nr:hypothetical protein [Deltaproteobacteria bacterium]
MLKIENVFKKKYAIIVFFCCLIIPMAAWSAGNDQGGDQLKPKGPPPEIVAACQGLAENAACRVETSDGPFNGTCQMIQGQSACVLRKRDAPTHLQAQWETLDRNHDGFLDINEIHGEKNQAKKGRDNDGPPDDGKDRNPEKGEKKGPGASKGGK